MLPLVQLLDGQGTVVIRFSEATDGVGRDAEHLTRKSAHVAGTSRSGYSRGRRVPRGCAQVELPPADVPPLAALPADVPVDADRLEAQCLVHADAGVVRQRDA